MNIDKHSKKPTPFELKPQKEEGMNYIGVTLKKTLYILNLKAILF